MSQTRYEIYTLGMSFFSEAMQNYNQASVESNDATAIALYKKANANLTQARKKFEESKATASVNSADSVLSDNDLDAKAASAVKNLIASNIKLFEAQQNTSLSSARTGLEEFLADITANSGPKKLEDDFEVISLVIKYSGLFSSVPDVAASLSNGTLKTDYYNNTFSDFDQVFTDWEEDFPQVIANQAPDDNLVLVMKYKELNWKSYYPTLYKRLPNFDDSDLISDYPDYATDLPGLLTPFEIYVDFPELALKSKYSSLLYLDSWNNSFDIISSISAGTLKDDYNAATWSNFDTDFPDWETDFPNVIANMSTSASLDLVLKYKEIDLEILNPFLKYKLLADYPDIETDFPNIFTFSGSMTSNYAIVDSTNTGIDENIISAAHHYARLIIDDTSGSLMVSARDAAGYLKYALDISDTLNVRYDLGRAYLKYANSLTDESDKNTNLNEAAKILYPAIAMANSDGNITLELNIYAKIAASNTGLDYSFATNEKTFLEAAFTRIEALDYTNFASDSDKIKKKEYISTICKYLSIARINADEAIGTDIIDRWKVVNESLDAEAMLSALDQHAFTYQYTNLELTTKMLFASYSYKSGADKTLMNAYLHTIWQGHTSKTGADYTNIEDNYQLDNAGKTWDLVGDGFDFTSSNSM